MVADEASKRMEQHCLEFRSVLPKNARPMSKQTFLAVDLGAGSGRVMAAIVNLHFQAENKIGFTLIFHFSGC